MTREEFRKALQNEREQFRAAMKAGATPFAGFDGRIAVVLSGGGARGAYEAGTLLAFQDAELPTHIVAATSVGSINAAFYASNSRTLVGNAEALVDSWAEITPPTVGIDWSRYIFMLAGLVAATAGFFNALRAWFQNRGIFIHGTHPVLTWGALMLAGACILLLYDQLPYIAYVVGNAVRGGRWKPDRMKALRSVGANLLVWGFVYLFLNFTHLHIGPNQILEFELSTKLLALIALLLIAALWFMVRDRLSLLSHKFLRLPLRTGLFPNYERAKFLRGNISAEGLRASPMRVVMTATDIMAGAARYFCNAPVEEIIRDPQVNANFVSTEVEQAEDLLQAVVSSSAFTIAYEAVPMQGRLWTDGGIVTNQPIRPAVRLGADVLFLVMVQSADEEESTKMETFLDVGVRAIDILVAKNLKADLKLLDHINKLCVTYATTVKLRPEEIELQVGKMSYKYIKAFTVCPRSLLAATALDFDGKVTMPAILAGYQDGTAAAREFADYVATLPSLRTRRVVRLVAEEAAVKAASS